jgi:putative membrane protein
MIDGFLGTRASLMLDVVFVAMFVVLPVMGWSIWQVRYRRRYLLHKRVQLTLGIVLLATVTLFEIDMRTSDWSVRAQASPYYSSGIVEISLWIHLFFAVPTAVLWVYVIVQALRRFPSVPLPGAHSRQHLFWGRLAALEMTLTAVTGWIFYWLAFVAT